MVPAVQAGRISRGGDHPRPRPVAASRRRPPPPARARACRSGSPAGSGCRPASPIPSAPAMTLGALVVGVVAVTFALGLNWSLLRVDEDLNRSAASPVRIEAMGRGRWRQGRRRSRPASHRRRRSGRPGTDPATITPRSPGTSTRRARSRSARSRSTLRAWAVPFVGYQGDTGWLGYELIEGRWFSGARRGRRADQRVHRTGLHVGDTVTLGPAAHDHGHAGRRDLRHAARERRQPRPARDLGGPRRRSTRRPAVPMGGAARGRRRRPGLPLGSPGRDRPRRARVSSKATRPATRRSCCS